MTNEITGNKNTSSSFLDVLMALKKNIMKDLNVAEIGIIKQIKGDDYYCSLLNNSKTTIVCRNLTNIEININDLVLILFTNTDTRNNLNRYKSNQNLVSVENLQLHSNSYGIIVLSETQAQKSNSFPSGGTTGQVLLKRSNIDYDVIWGTSQGEKGDKGDTGTPAGFGTPTATIDTNVGTPSVVVTATGDDTAKVFNFAFKNLKGEKGDKGESGESSLPIGMIFASAIEITDARFHLLDGGTIAKDGIYAEFATMLETLYPNGDYTTSQYESDLGAYGQCGHFVIGADTIRLPKITKFVEGLSDISDLGKSYGAGLPNISGDFGAKTYSADTDPNGAFYWSWTDWWVTPKGTDKDKNTRVQFDASTFNSIYGNSTTVQPQSTAYPYYIVLANGYKSDVQVDIDNVATELNNKADKTLSNVTYPSITAGSTTTGAADRVIKQYLSSDGLTWYRLWASGWIECGGMRSKTSGERTSVKVTLPVAFSNTNYVVASTYHENNSSVATLTSEYFGYIAQKTTTGFYLSLYGASTGQSTTFYCCGY